MCFSSGNRYLIVSFHDLTPHSQSGCRQFLEDLIQLGIHRISLLVVPQWHGEACITENSEFVAWLRSLAEMGHEICLHGYTHQADQIGGGPIAQVVSRFYTAQEGEFYSIGSTEAEAKLTAGMDALRTARLPFVGFTAPAWLLSARACEVLRKFGFVYTTYLQHVEFLQENRRIYAPTLVFSVRSAWRRWISIRWVRFWFHWNRKTPVLRLAVHPGDLKYPFIRDTIFRLAQKALKTRTEATYAQLAEYSVGGKIESSE